MAHSLVKWVRTLRGKLLLLFSALVSLAVVEMFFLGLSIQRQDQVNQAMHASMNLMRVEKELIMHLMRQNLCINSYLRSSESVDAATLKCARKSEDFEASLTELESSTDSYERMLKGLYALDPLWIHSDPNRLCREIRLAYNNLVESIQSNDRIKLLRGTGVDDKPIRPVSESIMKFENAVSDLTVRLTKESERDGQMVQYYLPIFMITVIAGGGLILIFVRKRLSYRLQEMENATRYVTRGDFSHRIQIRGRDELTDLAMAYNSMADRLSELDSLKREFISHISHELKNPLAAIKQVNDFLSDGLIGSMNEKQKDLIRISQKNSYKLGDMLNNLLDISKIEAGFMEYRMQEEDLVSVVRNCIHEITPLSEEKQVKIGTVFVQPKLIFSFDKLRMSQVINNLLNNAVKFTAPGGIVIVRVDRVDSAQRLIPERFHVTRSDMSLAKGYAIVSVEDTGVGVPEEELDNVFLKFYQVTNGFKEHGRGTGLGLAISKSIVDAHEGFIWAEPGNRQGTNFRFVLPLDSKVVTKTLHIIRPTTA
ncbi:MAG: HAMP domain-containing protein [Acidobacteria bacterium]|nr:HAMP domain-containing protein [Acidobacteriota bacterium]